MATDQPRPSPLYQSSAWHGHQPTVAEATKAIVKAMATPKQATGAARLHAFLGRFDYRLLWAGNLLVLALLIGWVIGITEPPAQHRAAPTAPAMYERYWAAGGVTCSWSEHGDGTWDFDGCIATQPPR